MRTRKATKSRIDAIASSAVPKAERCRKIANEVTAFLKSAGYFEMVDGEITWQEHPADVGHPLHCLLDTEHNQLLRELGLVRHGSYNAFVIAHIGALALQQVSLAPTA
jgi:hypothetical protein